ncbi:MAG: AAA family ATPase [Bacteroidia bacterium]|nr:AAA family ATPase [Bacteroidia bacterium]
MENPHDLNGFLAGQRIVKLIDEYHFLVRDNASHAGSEAILRAYLRELGKRLRLSGPEVRAFIQIFKLSAWDGFATKSDLASQWKQDLTGAGELFKALQLLEMKGLITRKSTYHQKVTFAIPVQVAKDVFHNRTPEVHCLKLDAYGLADRINEMMQRMDVDLIDRDDAYGLLCSIVARNRELNFSKKFRYWNLNKEEALLVAFMYANTLLDEHILQTESVVNRIFGNSGRSKSICSRIQRKESVLFTYNIICHADEEFETGSRIMFSDETLHALFGEDEVLRIKKGTVANKILPVIKHQSVAPRKLHYNNREAHEMSMLEKSLQHTYYQRIVNGLTNEGLAPGLTILLYGPPGTGKTESVLQLAKATERDILKVDIATLRNKWVGESEKQVKRIFENYREHYRLSPVAPILLMNEADGIISTRTKEIIQSTDQMHNAMQNILLEELESFEGILMATTNLESKLDPAFERRFLHKIRIDLPAPEVRLRILADRISFLSEGEIKDLALDFQLSGGQLENVTKKVLTAKLLTGEEPSFEEVRSWFASEKLNSETERTRIRGFQIK